MRPLAERFDIAIIGAGMAGASLAAAVAPHARVLLLEAEAQAGYHSTGRSAAFWSETYGGPLVQPLTTASFDFLAHPPADVSERSFLSPRGALHIADEAGEAVLDRFVWEFEGTGVRLDPVDRAGLEAIVRGLRPGWNRGLAEPTCADIDVAALHAAYLKMARRAGARLVLDAGAERIERDAGAWKVTTPAGAWKADILVNAAGAWADAIAERAGEVPLGIQPYRRTIVQAVVDPPAPADLPLVIDAEERFYFKPEAGGRLWLSPHDETATDPCDAAPDELDIATAIARFEDVTTTRVQRVERSWAGLRSFAPDRRPVYGFSGSGRGFFWCAGQGGFGIQTAPAGAALAGALLLGRVPEIDPAPYGATRFR